MGSFIAGLDLGQSQDFTALAILERLDGALQNGKRQPAAYHLRHLERPRLGTPYPAIVARVKVLLDTPPLRGNATLVVDATGVGAPVIDLLRQAGLRPVAVTITGGDTVSQDANGFRVPKRDLVSALLVLFQSGRLKIAEGIPDAATLVQELLAFRVKIDPQTAHDSYAAWREGAHDDLVLAAALAAWYGERFPAFGFAEIGEQATAPNRWRID
jgi:hypothetical protein